MTDENEFDEEDEATPSALGIWDILCLAFRVLWRDIAARKWIFAAAILFAVAATACESLAPMLLERIIESALPQKDLGSFLRLSAGILVLMLGFLFFWMVQISFSIRASELTFVSFRKRMVAEMLRKDDAFFAKYSPGDLMARLSNDIDLLQEHFYGYIVCSLIDIIYVTLIVVFLFFWNWRMALVIVAAIPAYALVTKFASRPIHALAFAARQKLSRMNGALMELVGGQRTIRFYQQERGMIARFAERCREYAGANIRAVRAQECALAVNESMTTLVTMMPFFVGGLIIFWGSDTVGIGDLVAAYTYLNFISTSLTYPFDSLASLSHIAPTLGRIQELCDHPVSHREKHLGVEETPNRLALALEKINFAYSGGPPILKDVSLTIEPGEKLAIMGPSGCGKSTLMNILLRFIEPNSGTLRFGERDAADYAWPFYLSFFSYVSQDTYLFNLSVKENIAMGWLNVPDDVVRKALRVVRLDKAIDALPQGVDTVVGEEGFNLSGGQRQRLAMARAMVRDPQILVLDEFTSALDKKVQDEILDDLLAIFKSQTIICVTHSEEVAARFDRIYRMETMQKRANP